MRRLLTIFSLLMLVAVAFAAESNATNTSLANLTVNATGAPGNLTVNASETPSNVTVNQTTAPTNATAPAPQNQTVSNASMPLEQLVKIQAEEINKLREQIEILNAKIDELKKENAELKERIAELEEKPVTWEDVQETVDTYYALFSYWTGWFWPLLAFFLIFKYRKPAREEEAERIEEAAEKVAKEKQREWFSFQIRKRGIESVAEDETELSIFRALGINTIGDLLEADEPKLLEAFKKKYHPSEDLVEHFKNRLKAIKEGISAEVG
jgi:TolA-binding protein